MFCAFIFDKQILDPLLAYGASGRRAEFIYASLQALHNELKRRDDALIVRYAGSVPVIPELAQELALTRCLLIVTMNRRQSHATAQ